MFLFFSEPDLKNCYTLIFLAQPDLKKFYFMFFIQSLCLENIYQTLKRFFKRKKRVDTKKFYVSQNNDYESFLTHVVVESLEEILFYAKCFFIKHFTFNQSV